MLYWIISTVNVTGCIVLKLCDGQLAVHASDCTLCGYVLVYYSALFFRISQPIFVTFPICSLCICYKIYRQKCKVYYGFWIFCFRLIRSSLQASVQITFVNLSKGTPKLKFFLSGKYLELEPQRYWNVHTSHTHTHTITSVTSTIFYFQQRCLTKSLCSSLTFLLCFLTPDSLFHPY